MRDENRLICTMTATKIGGKGQVVVHLADEQIDLMEQFRSRMQDELL